MHVPEVAAPTRARFYISCSRKPPPDRPSAGNLPTRLPGRDKEVAALQSFVTLPRKVICPTGAVGEIMSSPSAKNILLLFFGNLWFPARIPFLLRGALRDRPRTLGWDAVDAAASGAIVSQGEQNS
jgi:hypothetical protein